MQDSQDHRLTAVSKGLLDLEDHLVRLVLLDPPDRADPLVSVANLARQDREADLDLPASPDLLDQVDLRDRKDKEVVLEKLDLPDREESRDCLDQVEALVVPEPQDLPVLR